MPNRNLLASCLLLASCGQDYDLSAPVDIDPASITPCPFEEIPGTRYKRYSCNPVFTGSDEEWIQGGGVGSIGFMAEEVLGHPFYQMWYANGSKDGNYAVGYAISADGVEWVPNPANPVYENPQDGWNRDSMGAVTVVYDGSSDQYVLAYQGINYDTNENGLGMLQSTDGTDWTETNDGKEIIGLSEPVDGISYCWPLALTWDADLGFQGYINGSEGNGFGVGTCEVYGYSGATLDVIDADPKVLLPAGPGWDDMGVASASVVKFDDTWYMFYVGFVDWQPSSDPQFVYPYDTQLGMATSTDGRDWVKADENPFKDIALTQNPSVVGSVAAVVVGRRIHLWIDDWYEDVGGNAVGYFLYEPDSAPFAEP